MGKLILENQKSPVSADTFHVIRYVHQEPFVTIRRVLRGRRQ